MTLTPITEININFSSPEYYSVTANGNKVLLSILGYTEPNNGRDLYIVSLTINDKDETAAYFGSWNRTAFIGHKFQFSDPQNRFCFIPAESGYFLLDTKTLEKIKLRVKGSHFEGNIFDGDKHLVINLNRLDIIDLKTKNTHSVLVTNEYRIEWAYFINTDVLRIIHYCSNKYSILALDYDLFLQMQDIQKGDIFKNTFRWIVWSYRKQDNKNILEVEWVGTNSPKNDYLKYLLEDNYLGAEDRT
jgi:hypothetical protein